MMPGERNILVIDELHNIMGAEDAEGAMNAANILKPWPVVNQVISSTTLDSIVILLKGFRSGAQIPKGYN